MSEETKRWTEDQIVEAFNNFRNSNAAESQEKAEEALRGHLKEISEGLFSVIDIMVVAGKLVPTHCTSQMAGAIVTWLDDNASPAVLQ